MKKLEAELDRQGLRLALSKSDYHLNEVQARAQVAAQVTGCSCC